MPIGASTQVFKKNVIDNKSTIETGENEDTESTTNYPDLNSQITKVSRFP